MGGNLVNSQEKLMLLNGQLKHAFKAVKHDISQLDAKFDHLKDEEVEKLKEENKLLEATLKKVLDLEHEYKKIERFREATKEQHEQLKEKIKEIENYNKENYAKNHILALVKKKSEEAVKDVKEKLKDADQKMSYLKSAAASKDEMQSLRSQWEEYTAKIRVNFNKAADKFKEVESNAVDIEEIKAIFPTKEQIEEKFKKLQESIEEETQQNTTTLKKHIDSIGNNLHEKVNGTQKELDKMHDQITMFSRKAEVLVHKEELAKASEKFIEIEELNKILDNIETLKKEVYEAPQKAEMKEVDNTFKKQMEKVANDIQDKVNSLRKEFDHLNEKIGTIQEKIEKSVAHEDLQRISRNFVNIEDHSKVHEKIDEVKEMINTLQFSDTEVKKLRSNVDKIILALVPKKEHDKSIENIHKKLQSLKEDIDEIDKKIK